MMNNGEINIAKTHPNMYWMLMAIAFIGIALAVNFFFLRPTFPIWGVPNAVWATIFLVSSVARLITLNIYRRLRWVRYTMAFSMGYMLFLTVGTAVPGWKGDASLQLPLVYALVVIIQFFMMREPFLNPKTAN